MWNYTDFDIYYDFDFQQFSPVFKIGFKHIYVYLLKV